MVKKLKDSVSLNCKIERSVNDMLEEFVESTGMTKTAVVERALLSYIDEETRRRKPQRKRC